VDVPIVTAAEFNRRPSQIERAAEDQRLPRTPTNLAEWLAMDDELEFEIEPVGLEIRPANV
jgi:hypothetical protein